MSFSCRSLPSCSIHWDGTRLRDAWLRDAGLGDAWLDGPGSWGAGLDRAGLEVGGTVVVKGNERLREGQPVRIGNKMNP